MANKCPLLRKSQLAFKGAKVLYGSPCGHAVPLEDAYWCEDSQLIIGEQVRQHLNCVLMLVFPNCESTWQCTSKELDSFLSPDCHHIYDLQQAEMFQNKYHFCFTLYPESSLSLSMSAFRSLNSFECPRCGSALCTVSQDSVVRGNHLTLLRSG
eukprot:SAG31_NODE_1396_length_8511_cov_1.939491_10_plen_154_part_00